MTKAWNLNDMISRDSYESTLDPDQIVLSSLFTEDYLFTEDEINAECESLKRVGSIPRIVVERSEDQYLLLGPLLPFLALQRIGIQEIPCVVHEHDLPQIQQVLSIHLNADYRILSPLLYARLIRRLTRIYPIMKSLSGRKLGIKRTWIASILGISPSAVLRYSYINQVPAPLQLRCNNKQFPYLCYKNIQHFNEMQFRQLLDDLIHYELHSRYVQISASELDAIIDRIAADSTAPLDPPGSSVSTTPETVSALGTDTASHLSSDPESSFGSPFPHLYDDYTSQYYQNLVSSYEDRFDDEMALNLDAEPIQAAKRDSIMIPDDHLREISYSLYRLSRIKLMAGQRLLDYACLRSIEDSLQCIYSRLSNS